MTTLTSPVSDNPLETFQWTPQPTAEALVRSLYEGFVEHSPFAARLRDRLYKEAGVRLLDLIEQIRLPSTPQIRRQLVEAGFVHRPSANSPAQPAQEERFVQEQGLFPMIVLTRMERTQFFVKVESVADFLVAWEIHTPIQGLPLAPIRQAMLHEPIHELELWAIERHGYGGLDVPEISPEQAVRVLKHHEAFRRRPRGPFVSDADGFAAAHALIDRAIADLGVGRACDLFFAAEREYWQRRNRAAQWQKARQDRLGIGWANHDHHTYRSSREHFAPLMAIFEKLGFVCRERFYAGLQAGWGAQILEQPIAKIIIFADVDLSPDEVMGDFAHNGLAPRQQLGTVGLWCALHGEAFLQAGMHHLECQFDFDGLKQQLESEGGVKVMKPFTNFPYLRQAFTEGEAWPVAPERIDPLRQAGRITEAQAAHFREHGAIGSHLENLERNDGFKGFNQTGISEIIHRTDPRSQMMK